MSYSTRRKTPVVWARPLRFFASVSMLALLTGCCPGEAPGARDVALPQRGGDCVATGTSVSVELIHSPNHAVSVPKADVAAGIPATYTLTDEGTGHTHEISISAADFSNLQAGIGVQVRSTFVSGHAHFVTVNCLE